jgi:hypothetical protein
MSTYVHRFIEVRRKQVENWLSAASLDEVKPLLEVGKYYSMWENGFHKYLLFTEDKELKEVDEKDVPVKWELVKWYANNKNGYVKYLDSNDEKTIGKYKANVTGNETVLSEHTSYCNNGGIIRDNYIGHGWNRSDAFSDRGYPDDMSDELAELLKDDKYIWGKTYVGLDEWIDERNKLVEEFKTHLIEAMSDNYFTEILGRLDNLEILLKDPFAKVQTKKKKKKCNSLNDKFGDDDKPLIPTMKYLFDYDFWDIVELSREINFAYRLCEEIYGFVPERDIRIVYYLS